MVKGIPLLAFFHCMFNALLIYKQANKQKRPGRMRKNKKGKTGLTLVTFLF